MNIMVIKCAGWTACISLTLLLSCKKTTDIDQTATASQGCQLQSELTVSNGSQQATTYTYNDRGQLIKSVAASSSGTPTTYTYSYDAAGNVSSALTQGATAPATSFNITNTYEYNSGRLIKTTAQSSSTLFASTSDSYTYDGAGQLATYISSSSDPNYGIESYTFTNGLLISGTIARGGQSLTLTVANGRITSMIYPDGRAARYTYNADGYSTRSEFFDKAGTLQSYITSEYSTTVFQRASTPYQVVPTINLYGSKERQPTRVGVYNADGSLKAETVYDYQVNNTGYISSFSYTQNQPGVSGSVTRLTTYSYSNCP